MRARRTKVRVSAGVLALCCGLCFFAAGAAERAGASAGATAADIDKNTTGLPTYPHLRRAVMDAVSRNTLGRQCTHFAADSGDPLEMVEDWYRKALPGAVESDVNQDSIYGSYFKLTGIRLTHENDFLTIYRTANGASTSIELFKCRGT